MKLTKRILWPLCRAVTVGLLVAAGLWFGRPGREREDAAQPPPSLDEAIRGASDYLVRHCDNRGQFVYCTNLDPKTPPSPRYNIIRHAGVIYALAASQRRHPSPEKLDTLRRAVGFLRRESLGPVPGQEKMLAVWSRPDLSDEDDHVQAKLGGTGLGLAALVSMEQIEPGAVPLDELRALGLFLVFMQKDDGSFCSKFDPAGVGRDDRWMSLYYPGEAALGLVMLYEKDPQALWLESAARAIAYLARTRQNAAVVEPDHWALLASTRLWPLCDRCDPPFPRETLVRHTALICRSMLAELERSAAGGGESGCFTLDGRTCPTATRVEGLTAALAFLPDSEAALRTQVKQAAGQGIDFLLRSQVRQGPCAGGFPHEVVSPQQKKDGPAEAPNDTRRTEIRMDYVQHALDGMIQWQELHAAAVGR